MESSPNTQHEHAIPRHDTGSSTSSRKAKRQSVVYVRMDQSLEVVDNERLDNEEQQPIKQPIKRAPWKGLQSFDIPPSASKQSQGYRYTVDLDRLASHMMLKRLRGQVTTFRIYENPPRMAAAEMAKL